MNSSASLPRPARFQPNRRGHLRPRAIWRPLRERLIESSHRTDARWTPPGSRSGASFLLSGAARPPIDKVILSLTLSRPVPPQSSPLPRVIYPRPRPRRGTIAESCRMRPRAVPPGSPHSPSTVLAANGCRSHSPTASTAVHPAVPLATATPSPLCSAPSSCSTAKASPPPPASTTLRQSAPAPKSGTSSTLPIVSGGKTPGPSQTTSPLARAPASTRARPQRRSLRWLGEPPARPWAQPGNESGLHQTKSERAQGETA